MKYRSNSFQDLGTDPSYHLFRIMEVKCGGRTSMKNKLTDLNGHLFRIVEVKCGSVQV